MQIVKSCIESALYFRALLKQCYLSKFFPLYVDKIYRRCDLAFWLEMDEPINLFLYV